MGRIRFTRLPNGHRIAIGVDGEGATVLCPAWWTSHLEEDATHPPFQAFIDAFAQRGQLVRFDRVGAGLSDRVPIAPSLDDEVATVLHVADAVQVERFSMLGISLGGPVALAVAARHPDRVDRVAVFGAFAHGRTVASADAQAAMLGIVRGHWGMGVRALADLFVPGQSHEERRKFGLRQRASADAETAAQLLEFTYSIDVRDELERVRAPVLVVHRRGDRAIPYASGRQIAAGVPNGTWHLAEGDAHAPWEVGELTPLLVEHFFGHAADWQHLRDRRVLVVEGDERPLTPLEHGVLVALVDRKGAVASKDELLEEVWGQRFSGSNVVEAVVRTLRRKLDPHAGVVETVVGHGYRYAG